MERRPQILFFFNDTATTEIYTLSLHDALPISPSSASARERSPALWPLRRLPVLWDRSVPLPSELVRASAATGDRKSTRLNSSHSQISYAVFCLKKKNIVCRRLSV